MSAASQSALRVGLIGFAGFGTQDHQSAMYLPALADREDVVIAAVAPCGAQDAARAAAAAERLGVPVEAGPQALLSRDDTHAVIVCAPVEDRVEVIGRCLAAGRHVLADKPLALTAQEVARLRDAARSADRVLAVAQYYRNHDLVVPVVAALRSGRVGLPWSVQADLVVAGGDPVGEGHELANLGVHPVDVVQFMLDQQPLQVHAARAHRGSGTEGFVMAVDYENGVNATIAVARTPGLSDVPTGSAVVHAYRVAGAQGTLSVDLTAPAVTLLGETGRSARWTGPSVVQACVQDFVDAAGAGRPPAAGASHALVASAVLDAAYLSLQTGASCPVQIPTEEFR